MQVKSFTFSTSDNFKICCNRWIPDNDVKIKGIVQLHHGMAEHCLRYDRFASILAENGYVVNSYDLRGHGKTAELSVSNKSGMFGKLADKNGFNLVVNDLNEIIQNVKNDYPDVPVILFGHSFGSFISQSYIEKHSENINGVILAGTAGPRPVLITFAKIICGITKFFCGKNKVVSFLSKLFFGTYLNRIENPENEYDWLSKDKMIISLYDADEWCGIPLTTSFYYDMMYGLKKIHLKKNMKKIKKDLPVYIIYGEEDPVGDYGKTVKALYDIYLKNGMSKVEIKSYPTDRHEILNEDDKENVEKDILNWLNKTV